VRATSIATRLQDGYPSVCQVYFNVLTLSILSARIKDFFFGCLSIDRPHNILRDSPTFVENPRCTVLSGIAVHRQI